MAEIYGWGIGRLGLCPTTLFNMGIQQFNAAVAHCVRADMEREKMEWNRTRMLAAWTLAPHVKKGSRLNPRDIATFPWEEETTARVDGVTILHALMQR